VLIAQASLSHAQESCVALVKGPIAFDVDACKPFDPSMFDTTKPKYKFIGDLDPAGRQELLNSYRGLVVKGTVVMSQAVKTGVSSIKGAMQGETTYLFIPPGVTSCQAITKKRVAGTVNEKCCNGTGDVPCLLGSGLIFADVKVTGDALVGGGIDKSKAPRKKHGKEYLEAERKYQQKKYKEAADLYVKAENANDIDVRGLFRMGNSYRELEKCEQAIRPLKKIWQLKEANKIWADEELDARRGIFLLARCHSKGGNPSDAIYYLNGFLLDPKKYRDELQLSLRHKDFGWIHTSKEYQQYKIDAQRKLGSQSP
jgi:hypothetical protein